MDKHFLKKPYEAPITDAIAVETENLLDNSLDSDEDSPFGSK